MSKKIIVSLIITIWLLLQIYTAFLGNTYQNDTWPFTNYPMYAPKQKIGDRAVRLRLYGQTVSGEVIEVTAEDFGMKYWGFRRQAWGKLLNPETRDSYASELIYIYNKTHGDASQKLRSLRVISESRVLTKNGPSDIIRETIFTYNPK